MADLALRLRYYAAKAQSALALYRRVSEGDSPLSKQALRLALEHLVQGRLTFVHSETKGDIARKAPPPNASWHASGGSAADEWAPEDEGIKPVHVGRRSESGADGGDKFREFTRRFLVRRLVTPGPKALFVGDLVLVRMQLETSPSEKLTSPVSPKLDPCPDTYPTSPLHRPQYPVPPGPDPPLLPLAAPDAENPRRLATPTPTPTPLASLFPSSSVLPLSTDLLTPSPTLEYSGDTSDASPIYKANHRRLRLRSQTPSSTAHASTPLSSRAQVLHQVLGGGMSSPGGDSRDSGMLKASHLGPDNLPTPPPPPSPSAAVLRRVAALEGAEMVSDDPEDAPFLVPPGHCWLLQAEGEETGAPVQAAKNAEEEDIDEWDSRRTGPVPCSQILGRAIYVCHSPVHHEAISNSPQATWMDAPVLAMELDLELLGHGTAP